VTCVCRGEAGLAEGSNAGMQRQHVHAGAQAATPFTHVAIGVVLHVVGLQLRMKLERCSDRETRQ
jgi:hypothetical protein